MCECNCHGERDTYVTREELDKLEEDLRHYMLQTASPEYLRFLTNVINGRPYYGVGGNDA